MTTVATTEIATTATPSRAMMTYNIRLPPLLLLLLDETVPPFASVIPVGGDVIDLSIVETSAIESLSVRESVARPSDCCCELVDPSVVLVEEIFVLCVVPVDVLADVVVLDDVLVDVIAVLVLVSVGSRLVVVVVSLRGS